MTKSKPKQPTDAQLKAAYAMWTQGDLSIWQVKAKTGIRAKVLLPVFAKLSHRTLKSPAAKAPKPEAKKAAKAAAAA